MPRSKGPIGYIEHRSPMKDETGEYLIHPQFVTKDIYDFKDMKTGMRSHNQMTPAQFVAAIDAISRGRLDSFQRGGVCWLGGEGDEGTQQGVPCQALPWFRTCGLELVPVNEAARGRRLKFFL